MKIVALSDTHGKHEGVSVPDGDVLVYAGDFMNSGRRLYELTEFADWFNRWPHQDKILVAGNHDRLVETYPDQALSYFAQVTYLQNSGATINGVKFWGSPWTPEYNHWAFNEPRSTIGRFWQMIPDDTDVLVTHGPPFYYLDKESGERFGDSALLDRLSVVQPKVHIFGHVHGGYGTATFGKSRLYNVAVCNPRYWPINPVTVIDL